MLFNTITFYVVFIVFLMVYSLLRLTNWKAMLAYVVAFDLLYFFQANATLCFLLPLTALFSWYFTKRMSREEGNARKAWTTFVIVIDLIPLLYYKYTNFGIEVFNQLLKDNLPLLDIALPIGISFYTFQAISHVVDVYKRKFTMDATLLEYLFYLTFFPLLLAGPITRAETLLPQIRRREGGGETVSQDSSLVYMGLWLVLLGLVKKCVVADYVAQYNNWIFDNPTGYSGFENLMGAIGYTVQIYCDFSGYSDMSIGIAAMMGFRLKENFNVPYQSLNITEFWHRWHISLSTWFRDYIYIPLGGNRRGNVRCYLNTLITMLVAGLWHGSTLMFLLWGALHGAGLVVHKACKKLFLDRIPNTLPVIMVSWLLAHVFVVALWIIFRSPDMQVATGVFSQIITDFDIAYLPYFIKARPVWTLMIVLAYIVHGIRTAHLRRLEASFIASPLWVKVLIVIIVLQLCVEFHTMNVRPFIYSQF